MIFNHSKVLKSCSLSTQSLASCVNYFVWNCLPCFSNTKIGSVTSFSILFNFQGPVGASADRLTTWLFYHRSDFLSSSFFQKLLNVLNLDVPKSLKSLWDFLTSIGSFQGLLAEALEVILLPQRLALKHNTTHRASCQHFSAAFFKFFCIHLKCTHLNVSKSVFLTECSPPWFHLLTQKDRPCNAQTVFCLYYFIG